MIAALSRRHPAFWLAVLAVVICLADTATAQRAGPPPSREAVQYSFSSVVKKAAPAVVNVYVRGRAQVTSPWEQEFRRFFGERFGMPNERVLSSLGSGVIVNPEGIVVTNAHVIKIGAKAEIRIALADRREFDGKVLLADEKSDIAVLRIEGNHGRFPYLEFADSDAAEVGDLVLAIGNPFGVGQTVTSGIISALGRTQVAKSDAQVFIQTDAAINPGNSGGGLVDMSGRVLGINTAIYSNTGGSLGIGFAIPANLVKLIVDNAVAGRKLERPWLGAKLAPMTRELAQQIALERVAGALVARVYEKSPAAEAGLQVGDVIISVDGHEVDDAQAVMYRLTTRGIGQRARLGLAREGRRLTADVSLRAAPKPGKEDVRNLSGQHPFDGARVANLSASIADELGVDDQDGVVVMSIQPGSTAARLGLRPGDIIVQVGRTKLDTVDELEAQLKQRQRLWQLVIRRGDQLVQLQVSG